MVTNTEITPEPHPTVHLEPTTSQPWSATSRATRRAIHTLRPN